VDQFKELMVKQGGHIPIEWDRVVTLKQLDATATITLG
jgi:hypothetical protein